MSNETNTTSNNTEIPNNGIQPTDNVETNNSVVTGYTEILEPIQNEQINQEYEEVTPQFQEVNIVKQPTRTDSYFDGGLLELIGWKILASLISVFTLGFGAPWGACMFYNYQYKHTVYNGKRLKFEGTGGDLFVNRFKWIFFSIITLGIYLFFIPVRKQQWITSNLHFEDENLIKGESFFDGKTLHLIGINILCDFLNIISLGLLFSFTVCFKLRWINKHTIINRKKLAFSGKALSLFGKYLLWIFLTLITFGIYGWWLRIKILKWETKNIHIKTVGEVEEKDNSIAIATIVAVVGIVLFILIVPRLFALIPDGYMPDGTKIRNPFGKANAVESNSKIIVPSEENYYRYNN